MIWVFAVGMGMLGLVLNLFLEQERRHKLEKLRMERRHRRELEDLAAMLVELPRRGPHQLLSPVLPTTLNGQKLLM